MKFSKKGNQKKILIVGGFLVFLFPQIVSAEEKTLTISHDNVTTTRGSLNQTYYEGNDWGSNSTNHWGNEGDFFEVSFSGNRVILYGNTNETNGKGTVFIDDEEVGEVNYKGQKASNVLLFTKENLEEGEHTIRVSASGWINHVSTVITYSEDADARQWFEKYKNLHETDYTSQSWSAYLPVFNEAKGIVTKADATAAELKIVRDKIEEKSKKLVMNSGLKQMVADYQKREKKAYTDSSWAGFATALELAAGVADARDASKEAVVTAKNQLQTAADNLVTTSLGTLQSITNNTFWHDTDGNPIYSQGGGIFRFGDKYYWYGVRYVEAEYYYNNPTAIYNANSPIFSSITCYSSTDLVNWKFENNIANQDTKVFIDPSKNVSSDYFSQMKTLADASWIGRLGVTYNENTGKYTLLTQMENKFDPVRATNACVLFLQGDSPTGNFEYGNIQTTIENAPAQGTGDQTVYTDDNGEDYLVFSSRNGRKYTYISKISDEDSLSLAKGITIGYVGSGREGNAMFKVDDRYYAASSDLHGWNTSVTYLISSQSNDIQGSYSNSYILSGTEKDYSHVTQTGFFVKVKGTKKETIIYCGDRWADFAWNGSGYNQWVPLSENEEGLYFNSLSDWQLNATTGEWLIGDGNNYILNPEFAADRVISTNITGWNNILDEDSASFVSNVIPGANGTRFGLKLGAAEAYSGSVNQENEISNGIYQFSLDVSGLGELDEAKILIEGQEKEAYTLDINQATDGWQSFQMKNIKLSAGTVKISIVAKSVIGNKYVQLDNLSLTKQSIDKQQLKEAVKQAESLRPSEGYEFTKISKENLKQAINKSKQILRIPNASTEKLTDAMSNLLDNMNELEENSRPVLPQKVSLNIVGTKKIKRGETFKIVPTFTPNNTTEPSIIWCIAKPRLVKVDENNVLYGLEKGTTKVTAKTINGKKATFKIKVGN